MPSEKAGYFGEGIVLVDAIVVKIREEGRVRQCALLIACGMDEAVRCAAHLAARAAAMCWVLPWGTTHS